MVLLVHRIIWLLLIFLYVCVLCISVKNGNRDNFCTNCKLSFTETSLQNLSTYELGTDSKFIFIFREDTPFLFFIENCMYGMSGSGFIYTRSVALLAYIYIVFVEHSRYYYSRQYFLCQLICRKHWLTHKNACKIRQYLIALKHIYMMRVSVVPIFLMLLLCGDVHPNPGPVLPRCLRHPGAQLLNVAS